MITVSGVSHYFGRNGVLSNVVFKANEGRVIGLVGINGAGKSTLLRIMSGVYKAQTGIVSYDGRSPSDAKTREDIFFLPDDPYYTNESTCKRLFDLYKMLYPDADIGVFKQITDEFGLPWKKPVRTFSKGMRRQAFIALAFAVSPKYMLLDEAFDGLDPLARKMFKDRIKALVKAKNTTVIISSHSLRELEDFCDDYLLIDKGIVVNTQGIMERNLGYAKYQLAFKEQIDEAMFEALPVKSLKITGRVATVTVDNESDIEDRLMALEPLIMDKLDVSFEEAFISDVDRTVRGEGGSVQ